MSGLQICNQHNLPVEYTCKCCVWLCQECFINHYLETQHHLSIILNSHSKQLMLNWIKYMINKLQSLRNILACNPIQQILNIKVQKQNSYSELHLPYLWAWLHQHTLSIFEMYQNSLANDVVFIQGSNLSQLCCVQFIKDLHSLFTSNPSHILDPILIELGEKFTSNFQDHNLNISINWASNILEQLKEFQNLLIYPVQNYVLANFKFQNQSIQTVEEDASPAFKIHISQMQSSINELSQHNNHLKQQLYLAEEEITEGKQLQKQFRKEHKKLSENFYKMSANSTQNKNSLQLVKQQVKGKNYIIEQLENHMNLKQQQFIQGQSKISNLVQQLDFYKKQYQNVGKIQESDFIDQIIELEANELIYKSDIKILINIINDSFAKGQIQTKIDQLNELKTVSWVPITNKSSLSYHQKLQQSINSTNYSQEFQQEL